VGKEKGKVKKSKCSNVNYGWEEREDKEVHEITMSPCLKEKALILPRKEGKEKKRVARIKEPMPRPHGIGYVFSERRERKKRGRKGASVSRVSSFIAIKRKGGRSFICWNTKALAGFSQEEWEKRRKVPRIRGGIHDKRGKEVNASRSAIKRRKNFWQNVGRKKERPYRCSSGPQKKESVS